MFQCPEIDIILPVLIKPVCILSRRKHIISLCGDNDKLIYLFGVLHHFQHCTGHITTGSRKGRGNQYIQFARVLYCKLPTNGKQLPAFPLEAVPGSNPGLRGER